jgi:hypothetical protein
MYSEERTELTDGQGIGWEEEELRLGAGGYACNRSHLRGWDREDHDFASSGK